MVSHGAVEDIIFSDLLTTASEQLQSHFCWFYRPSQSRIGVGYLGSEITTGLIGASKHHGLWFSFLVSNPMEPRVPFRDCPICLKQAYSAFFDVTVDILLEHSVWCSLSYLASLTLIPSLSTTSQCFSRSAKALFNHMVRK